MSNTTRLSQPIYELVQTLLDVRSTLEDMALEAGSLVDQYGDAPIILHAAQNMLTTIDTALDLIKYPR